MALHEQQLRQMGAGHAKSINAGAMAMVLDTLQRYQYNYPIPSTIREIVSNGLDSIKEKGMARAILSGKAKVEDYFIEREGDEYSDSHFDPDYYNLDCLGTDDIVHIHYVSGGSTESDYIVISDQGVGLGANRLAGYFELGYSTKRLSKLPLGKWGIGAKSPLSVGVDYYTLESVHNGRKYRFNIYSHSYDSIISRFKEDGTENPCIVFGEGTEDAYTVYYEPTTEKNGVKVIIGAKKFHKKQYIDAVKSQLLYFDNIHFTIAHENGALETVHYKANILYEDEYIVLSDNPYYTKPHLLLNKINYGYINWEHLELQDRTGNIGIKVAPEDIEVTPSREGVMWSEKTKAMVDRRFKDVQGIATRIIQEELNETDFWKWIRTCFSIGNRWGNAGNSIIGRLSKIIDINELQPSYLPNPIIKFQPMKMMAGLSIRHVYKAVESVQNRTKTVIKREELRTVGSHINCPIFYMTGGIPASNRKDKWLLSMYPDGFLQLREPLTEEKMQDTGVFSFLEIERIMASRATEVVPPKVYYDLLISSQGVLNYEDVVVPDDFTGTDSEEEEKSDEKKTVDEENEEKVSRTAAAERRKMEGKIVMHTPRILGKPTITDCTVIDNTGAKVKDTRTQLFSFTKLEQKISDINSWSEAEIYYGTEADDEVMHFVAALTRDRHLGNDLVTAVTRTHALTPLATYRWDSTTRKNVEDSKGWIGLKWMRVNGETVQDQLKNTFTGFNVTTERICNAFAMQHFYDTDIKLIKVSQSNVKYVRDFKHIQQFFLRITDNKITMSNMLVRWNTARIIKDHLHKVAFLYNFEQFNESYSRKYKDLTRYVDNHYNEIKEQAGNNYFGLNLKMYQDMVEHLDRVRAFQEFVAKNGADTEAISAAAQEMFGNKHISDGHAIDATMMEILQDVLDYAAAVGNMLNYIPVLTGLDIIERVYTNKLHRTTHPIPEDLEQEIKLYLEYKEVLDYGKEIISPTENPGTGDETSSSTTSNEKSEEQNTSPGLVTPEFQSDNL